MYILKHIFDRSLTHLAAAAALASCAVQAADLPSPELASSSSIVIRHAPPAGARLWFSSLGAIAAANALDIGSSVGKHELNPALAGPSGSIGVQGALIKLGIQAGIVSLEYLALRHRPSPKLYRAMSIINFGDAAVTGAVAAHNYSLPRSAAQ